MPATSATWPGGAGIRGARYVFAEGTSLRRACGPPVANPQGGRGGQLRGRNNVDGPSRCLAVIRPTSRHPDHLETAGLGEPRFVHVSTDESTAPWDRTQFSEQLPWPPQPLSAPRPPRTCWCGPATRPTARHGHTRCSNTTAPPVPEKLSAHDRPSLATSPCGLGDGKNVRDWINVSTIPGRGLALLKGRPAMSTTTAATRVKSRTSSGQDPFFRPG
jgi:hypothetical protein